MDLAAAAGYPVVCFDRPGYGGSAALPPAENTFGRHAQLLADAIGQAAARFPADGVFLTGHSIGGMIAMMIAAGDIDFRLTGLSVTGMGAVIRAGGPAHALASLPAGRDRGSAVRPAGSGDVRARILPGPRTRSRRRTGPTRRRRCAS